MSECPEKGAVGYVLRRFPVISETFILNEILALEARGVPVHVFALERPNDPRFHEGVPRLQASISYVPSDVNELWKQRKRAAHRFGNAYQRAWAYAVKSARPSLLWRFLQSCYIADRSRRFNVRHYHAHFATRATSVAFFAALLTGRSYSFTAHAMDIYKDYLSRKVLAGKMRNARFVVTISRYNQRILEEVLPDEPEKVVRVMNGIHLDRFQPNGTVPPLPFVFVCVARLVEKKGHKYLIEACRQLRDRGLSFQCWLIGKGLLRSPILAQIKDHDLGGQVKLLGPLRSGEVLERYHAAHGYVLPCVVGSDGNKDGLPVSIVEALACGLPVVSTPVTGIPEVVRNEENGLMVPSGDADALADAMERVVRDRALYDRLRANARRSVERDFDINRTSEKLKALFEDAMA